VSAPALLPPLQRFRLTFRLLQWRWQLVAVILPETIQNLTYSEMSLSKPRERGEGCSRLVPSRVVGELEVPPEEREAPEELNIRGTRLADIPTWRLKEAGMFGRGQVVKLNYG
jgi:hypothetical protein